MKETLKNTALAILALAALTGLMMGCAWMDSPRHAPHNEKPFLDYFKWWAVER